MSYNSEEAFNNEKFWSYFIKDKGKELLNQGWKGKLSRDDLEKHNNWDIVEDVFSNAVNCDGKEVDFAEDDGGGIPGSGDCVWVIEYGGLYFYNGSSISGGPFEKLDDAYREAVLNE